MQNKPKSQLYKRLFLISLAIFILGFVTALTGLLKLYGTVNNSGFGATTKSSSSNATGDITKAGGYIAAVGFYAGLLFLIMFVVSRRKEK
jgi:putative copper export protein